jgi:hypothetical protein
MNKIPLPVIIAVVVLAVGAAVYFGISSSQQPAYRPAAAPAVTDDSVWLKDMAKRSGGDITKLTPAERQRADQITRGFTEQALKHLANSP